MENPEVQKRISIQVTFELEPASNPNVLDRITSYIGKLGGIIESISEVEFINGQEHVPPNLLSMTHFRSLIDESVHPITVSKAWKVGQVLTERELGGDTGRAPLSTINLDAVMNQMRIMEQGNEPLWTSSMGRTAWNIYTNLINDRLESDTVPILLPWEEELHTKLRSNVEETRHSAATKIRDRYDIARGSGI